MLFIDESIELYPNTQLRYSNKKQYCNGKFNVLTDDEWFEFIYQNYLHFIIKMYMYKLSMQQMLIPLSKRGKMYKSLLSGQSCKQMLHCCSHILQGLILLLMVQDRLYLSTMWRAATQISHT